MPSATWRQAPGTGVRPVRSRCADPPPGPDLGGAWRRGRQCRGVADQQEDEHAEQADDEHFAAVLDELDSLDAPGEHVRGRYLEHVDDDGEEHQRREQGADDRIGPAVRGRAAQGADDERADEHRAEQGPAQQLTRVPAPQTRKGGQSEQAGEHHPAPLVNLEGVVEENNREHDRPDEVDEFASSRPDVHQHTRNCDSLNITKNLRIAAIASVKKPRNIIAYFFSSRWNDKNA